MSQFSRRPSVKRQTPIRMGMGPVSHTDFLSFAFAWKIITGILLVTCFLLSRTAIAETYYPPPESKGGWRTLVTKNAAPTVAQKSAVLNAAGLDTDHLVAAWNYVESLGQRQSLIVIRHGWIAGEWDYVGVGPINSSTKSLTGLALARLFELSDADRLPKKIGYDDFAYNYLPATWANSDPRKKLIKVRDLPTMCSGLQAMDRGIRDLDMALALPVVHPPETVDQYSSASVMLEGMIIENASGQSLKSFFRRHISEPIGAESVRLWDAHGAAGYAFMQTRDFARFGYLMLHDGAWDDGTGVRQLVRPDLIARCRQWPTFLMNVTDGPGNNATWLTTNDPPSHYLHTWHGWWVNWSPDWPSSQGAVWPFVPKDAFWMSGYGKDICVVIPSLDMIIAHQTARAGNLEQTLSDCPEFLPTLLSKVMAAVVMISTNSPADTPTTFSAQVRANDIPRFGMFEKIFHHLGTYDNPYKDLTAVATLRRPDGKEWTMPLFWDGKTAWMLRVSPDFVGEWSYSIRSPDAGLNAKTGSFRCVESSRHGSIRSMRDHALHFEYQDGTPFWFFGEKAWRVFQTDPAEKLDHQTAMHHVDVRAKQGFNYLHTELAGTGGLASGGNEGGEMFLDARKELINPAFFQEVDSRLRHINEKGMICGMVLLYAKGDPSWKSLPDDQARLRFARYVVARYAAFDIVFLVTGEWHFMANQPDLFRAIGREILRTDPHGRMIGIHPGPESVGVSSQEFAQDDWMSFGEYAQAYFAPHAREATDANRDGLRKFILAARKHNKPVVDAEYAYYLRDQDYDGSVDKPHSHTRDSFRRASWAISMGGGYFVTGFGTTYFGGRREVGPFLVDNPRHKDALLDLDHLHTFFTSLQWWLLEPHDELVKADGGYAYCLADAGRTYVIYTAGGRGATMKLEGGEYSLWRCDPRTGQSTELHAITGDLVQLVAPDTQDWVFLVKAMVGARLAGRIATEKPATITTSQPGSEQIQRWDTCERSLEAAGSYANPFQDVHLAATFTHESSEARFTVDGFHDGDNTWRFRFIPTQLGTWRWTTASNDPALDGKTGTLECVAPTKPYLHGPLTVRGRHFVHADGTPRFLISTRLTCQFAPPSTWPALIAFLKESRINRVLFMMPGVDSKKDPVHTQRNLFAPGPDYTRYNVEAFRAIDEFIDALRQADILASPYFYYDPRREVMWKMTPEQDKAYIRYGMSRLGAFSNVMPVLGNEIELKTTNYKDPAFDLRSHAWANEMGTFLKSRAVFGQPVSVHNPCWQEFAVNPSYFTLLREWPFAGWTDFVLKQAQVGCIGAVGDMSDSVPQPQEVIYNERSYSRHNQILIDLRKYNQPVINEEPAYDMGSKSAYASQTPETMRPTFWTAATAGAYTIWGNKSTYVTGDPLGPIRESLTPRYLRVLHDVMTGLPYGQMEPLNESVTPANVILDGQVWRTNFALVRSGDVYLVYSLAGGTGMVTLAPGRYCAVRVDPRDATRLDLGEVAGGAVGFSLPQGKDWVLIYRRTALGNR